ncbi:IS1595 family transposase [Pasteurella multocida]|uniref:IS1595 family transposase n=1 Tax=Pasteurella multocida TaxID=747 RepID=UPI00099B3FB6|nr:IS1595 family transposase [Pasteurella multocida]MCL7766816.1 IS1595 family transposase [Pasteurella multocida]MCL7824993.1 IS1595 family transposase [Pasteurella multocida]MCL7829374.1 IS1595 family transposase [Pasteurella multocida]MCL7833727.1 IS1595 family transposase [Pasteurella multocida]OPC86239.1 DDE transposase [Pasteurella multocida subsp. multocida]
MAQLFLLSTQAKTLSIRQVMTLTDNQAFSLLCEIRWGSKSLVTCPKCGCQHHAYFISSRQQFRCKVKGCGHTFSVTSGTIFANRKLPIQTYLLAIVLFVNAVKGLPALQLSRDLGVQYKTAYVLAQKLRKSLLEQREIRQFSGLVEMDGTYVHPAPRKANKKTDRIDYRLKENQNPDKRCVMVAREHYSEAEKQSNRNARGAKSTHIFVTYSETQSVVKQFADKFIERGSRIHTDESNAYSVLMPFYDLCTVNHQHEYRSDEGITNNQAESYFSRFKRMYYGQVHKMSNLYLLSYANEAAYREDNRRQSNGWQFLDVLEKCLNIHNETEWCGYWQRKITHQEVIWQ